MFHCIKSCQTAINWEKAALKFWYYSCDYSLHLCDVWYEILELTLLVF